MSDLQHISCGGSDLELAAKQQNRASSTLIQGGNQINRQLVNDINQAVARQQNLDENIILRPKFVGQTSALQIHDVG